MKKDFTEIMLEIKVLQSRNKLIGKIKILQTVLENNLNQLTDDENYYPNALGVVQSLGQEIDVLCAKLGALHEIKEVMDADE